MPALAASPLTGPPRAPRPQAYECRFPEDAYAKLDEAHAVAETDGARARLAAARGDIEDTAAAKAGGGGTALTSSVMLTLLRLSPDELGVRWGRGPRRAWGGGGSSEAYCRRPSLGSGRNPHAGSRHRSAAAPAAVLFRRIRQGAQPPGPRPARDCPLCSRPRPLPQLPELGRATAAELAAAPRASQEGAFGAFTVEGAGGGGGGHKWVALPQWKALSLARRPAALPVADCSKDAAILGASQVGGAGARAARSLHAGDGGRRCVEWRCCPWRGHAPHAGGQARPRMRHASTARARRRRGGPQRMP